MNPGTKPVAFDVDGHPDENQLLLALEHELPAEDANRIEKHLGNCWSCRARSDEMQRGILAFVEYREKRYLPSVPPPPDDTSGFRDRLRRVDSESSQAALPVRIWRWIAALFTWPRQLKWASAIASVTALAIFWVQVLVNPRAVSANELLTRAVAAQNPPVSDSKATRRRVAHQKMQIRSGTETVVRDFEWKVDSPIQETRWDLAQDPLTWNTPLTAQGFADWRDSLGQKRDEVKRSGTLLTLDTTTAENVVTQAWIVVRANDFHPVEQHLRFKDNRQLDFTELAFEFRDEAPAAPAMVAQVEPKPAGPSKLSAGSPVSHHTDLNETELQLRYTLFIHQWDLGEDLSIGRAAGQVTLGGTVSSREREEAMRAALGTLPNLQLSLDLPSGSNAPDSRPNGAIVTKAPAASATPLLKATLDQMFVSREERLSFVDKCLASSDTALSHAWALKRLVERYPDVEEQLLKPESASKLREMLRVHLRELNRANDGLEPMFELLPAARIGTPGTPADWRGQILSLFSAVQQEDRLVASLLVGSQTDGQDISTASANLRSAHQTIRALFGGLKEVVGEPTAR